MREEKLGEGVFRDIHDVTRKEIRGGKPPQLGFYMRKAWGGRLRQHFFVRREGGASEVR